MYRIEYADIGPATAVGEHEHEIAGHDDDEQLHRPTQNQTRDCLQARLDCSN